MTMVSIVILSSFIRCFLPSIIVTHSDHYRLNNRFLVRIIFDHSTDVLLNQSIVKMQLHKLK